MGIFRTGQKLQGGLIEIIDRIGTGGFSEVYLALRRHDASQQKIVVKCFNTSGMSREEMVSAQLLNETEAKVKQSSRLQFGTYFQGPQL